MNGMTNGPTASCGIGDPAQARGGGKFLKNKSPLCAASFEDPSPTAIFQSRYISKEKSTC